MDNPHSTKAYETPMVLFQSELDQATGNYATGNYAGTNECIDSKDMKQMVFGKVLTQMTAKTGIRLYGEAAVQALMQEFAQLEDLGVYLAKSANELTREQKGEALRAINLIKKKIDGRIKGRTVADGSVQKDLNEKSQTASPTVSTNALLISLIIDAHEQRDVAVADVLAAYLKAGMNDYTLLKFTGESVDIICKMNPKYE